MELNAAERRALRLAVGLVVLGTAVRFGFGPGPATYAWSPAAGGGDAEGEALGEVRRAVDGNLERARRAARPLAAGERIDPNRADGPELQRLPGVGPATADAILRRREEAGGFRSKEDLLRVRGVGPVTLRRIGPHLKLPERSPHVRPGSTAGAADSRLADGTGQRDALDLNRATAAELERLSGVGPVLARRILAERQRLGRFKGVEELLGVRGIGPVRLEALRPFLTVVP